MLDQLRVAPGAPAGLEARDPADRLGLADKQSGGAALDDLRDRLDDLIWGVQDYGLVGTRTA